MQLAHRVAIKAFKKEDFQRLIEGWEVSHLCHNPICINPYHLIAETHAQNNTRRNCNALTRDEFFTGGEATRHPQHCQCEPRCIQQSLEEAMGWVGRLGQILSEEQERLLGTEEVMTRLAEIQAKERAEGHGGAQMNNWDNIWREIWENNERIARQDSEHDMKKEKQRQRRRQKDWRRRGARQRVKRQRQRRERMVGKER